MRSGEVGSLREGRRVGESRLRRRSEFEMDSVIRVPLASASVATCCLRVPGRAMSVEVSHDDDVITEVKRR